MRKSRMIIRIEDSIKRAITSLLITLPLALVAARAAYLERGYFALGGEWIMTIMMFAIVHHIIKHRYHWRIYVKRPKEN